MIEYNKCLFLEKTDGSIGFLISMLAALDKATSDREVTFEGNQIMIRKRTPEEIVTLNRDISELKTRIFDWFDARTSPLPLVLTEQESDLLRYCAHAAYYFVTENEDKLDAPVNQQFIDFYLRHFKKD